MHSSSSSNSKSNNNKLPIPMPPHSPPFCFFFLSFRAYEPNYEHPQSPGYCDEGTYKFAFYSLLISYALMALAVAMGCCFCVCACCAGSIAACFKGRK